MNSRKLVAITLLLTTWLLSCAEGGVTPNTAKKKGNGTASGNANAPTKLTNEKVALESRAAPNETRNCTDNGFVNSQNTGPPTKEMIAVNGRFYPCRMKVQTKEHGLRFVPGHSYYRGEQIDDYVCYIPYDGMEKGVYSGHDPTIQILYRGKYKYIDVEPGYKPPVNAVPAGYHESSGEVMEYIGSTKFCNGNWKSCELQDRLGRIQTRYLDYVYYGLGGLEFYQKWYMKILVCDD